MIHLHFIFFYFFFYFLRNGSERKKKKKHTLKNLIKKQPLELDKTSHISLYLNKE
jgi:hypothetical protein